MNALSSKLNQNRFLPALNIILVGVGGQGVILASNVIMHHFLQQRYDVKRSEIHGMAQRGGSVMTHIRVGPIIYSPTIPQMQAQFLIAIDEKEGQFMLKQHPSVLHYVALSAEETKNISLLRSKNIALLAKFFFILTNQSISIEKITFFSNYLRAERSLKTILPSHLLPDNLIVFKNHFNALCL